MPLFKVLLNEKDGDRTVVVEATSINKAILKARKKTGSTTDHYTVEELESSTSKGSRKKKGWHG